MHSVTVLAAGYLAFGFGAVSYIAVIVEPEMGFTSIPADFFDPDKVAAGYTSTAWLVSNVLYLTMPVAIWLLAGASADPYLRWSGLGAGFLLFVVGSIDRVGIQLPSLISDSGDRQAALVGLLAVRAAVLKSMVAMLGVFVWRTTRSNWGSGLMRRIWPALGYTVLVLSVVFVFVYAPVPIAILVWALLLTVYHATNRTIRPSAPQ